MPADESALSLKACWTALGFPPLPTPNDQLPCFGQCAARS